MYVDLKSNKHSLENQEHQKTKKHKTIYRHDYPFTILTMPEVTGPGIHNGFKPREHSAYKSKLQALYFGWPKDLYNYIISKFLPSSPTTETPKKKTTDRLPKVKTSTSAMTTRKVKKVVTTDDTNSDEGLSVESISAQLTSDESLTEEMTSYETTTAKVKKRKTKRRRTHRTKTVLSKKRPWYKKEAFLLTSPSNSPVTYL